LQNVCADDVTTCSSQAECRACDADGSAVIFSLAVSKRKHPHPPSTPIQGQIQRSKLRGLSGEILSSSRFRSRMRWQDPDATVGYLEIENFDAWLQDAGGCDGAPSGGAYFRTSCQTWSNARLECQAGGGDLVVIADADKNAEVTAFVQSFDDYGSCMGPYPWVGAQNCAGSACEWVDGTCRLLSRVVYR
jgi:hypothetical protein